MLRRSVATTTTTASAASKKIASGSGSALVLCAPRAAAAQRSYVSPTDPIASLIMMSWCIAAGGAWGNNIHSVSKFGIFRHMMWIDNPIVTEGSRVGMFIGGTVGFLFYWYIMGPMKYKRSHMDQWATKIGPF